MINLLKGLSMLYFNSIPFRFSIIPFKPSAKKHVVEKLKIFSCRSSIKLTYRFTQLKQGRQMFIIFFLSKKVKDNIFLVPTQIKVQRVSL